MNGFDIKWKILLGIIRLLLKLHATTQFPSPSLNMFNIITTLPTIGFTLIIHHHHRSSKPMINISFFKKQNKKLLHTTFFTTANPFFSQEQWWSDSDFLRIEVKIFSFLFLVYTYQSTICCGNGALFFVTDGNK